MVFKHYLLIVVTSFVAFLAVCWTMGIRNCAPAWNESVLFFTVTYLFLKRYGAAGSVMPITLCVLAGRLLPDVLLLAAEIWLTGSVQPAYSWYVTLMSVVGALAGAVYFRWHSPAVLVSIIAGAVMLNTLVPPVWTEFIKGL